MPNANAATTITQATPPQAGSGPSAPPPLRARVLRAAGFAFALGAVAFLLASAQVPCGFAHTFHVPCPGCGSTRAMLALAHGDLHSLVRYNPLAPFMSALVLVLAVQAFASVLGTGTLRRVGDGPIGVIVSRGMIVVALLELLVWFARFSGFLGGPVPV
jgi:hypothetical protein